MDCLTPLFVLSAACLGWACSPEMYRTIHMDEMAHGASIIAYGSVTKTFKNKYFAKAYDVEFQVKCTYKGGQIPSKINITDVGFIPGMCADKNFTVGTEYLAFLDVLDGRYQQIYDDTKQAGKFMTELMTFCGLHMEYPADLAEKERMCERVPSDASRCHGYLPPEVSKTPTGIRRPMEPVGRLPEDGDEVSGEGMVPRDASSSSTTPPPSKITTTTTTTAATTTTATATVALYAAEEENVGSLTGSGVHLMFDLCLIVSVVLAGLV